MNYSVLIVDNDRKSLDKVSKELQNRGLNIRECTNFYSACELLKTDGSIHVVLSEWELPRSEKNGEFVKGMDIFRQFIALRYEVSLFLYTEVTDSQFLSSGGILNGYF